MRKFFFIVQMEYKMQMKRIATWCVLVAATGIAMMDCFPSAGNLARLEFLTQPDYFTYRIMSLCGLVLLFGLVFLLSSRFPMDKKTGTKPLFMAAPVKKGEYVGGKLIGGFLYTSTVVALFLVLNCAIYAVFGPASPADCLVPLLKTLTILGLPASFFISFCAVALPAVMDIRLFYLLFSAMFILNAAVVGSAGRMPFYLITSGDLSKLIWQHPKYPFSDTGSMAANLLFLVGSSLLPLLLLLGKRNFWRAEG